MQFNIRNLPPRIHRQLKIAAAQTGATMEATAIEAIDRHTAPTAQQTANQEDTKP